MKKLIVSVEINGQFIKAGILEGNDYKDACFTYEPSYMDIPGIKPISISLPFQEKPFSALRTKAFFEGLLPEGFSRRAVAGWARADHDDYLTILAKLGQECLGAIRIDEDETSELECGYSLLTDEQVKVLAAEGATKSAKILLDTHLSLTGATGKAGLYYDKASKNWYLPIGSAASTHIVKQSHVRYKRIVLNEQLCIRTAKKLGIDVPDTFIVNIGKGQDEDILYAIERFDRKLNYDKLVNNLPCPYRQHQEDFCQAMGILAADKYELEPRNYMKKMFDLVRDYSSNPLQDQMKLWNIIVFNYLIGNTDCHLKNYSFLYEESFKGIRLAPAYDIVCTKAYGIKGEMSFYIGGELELAKINRSHFQKAAREIGIGSGIAMKYFDNLTHRIKKAAIDAAEELAEEGFETPDFWRILVDEM